MKRWMVLMVVGAVMIFGCGSVDLSSENSPARYFRQMEDIQMEGDFIASKEAPGSAQTTNPPLDSTIQSLFDRPWSVMYYHGVGTSTDLGQTLAFDIDWEDSQFVGLVLNRAMFPFWRHFTFELEGQVLKHFEKQNNWEYNGLILVRFHPFILDQYLDIDFAAGEGLSYASSLPVIEEEQHPDDTSRLLNYIMFEVAFTLPRYRNWTLVTRIHHRSGVFGIFNGARGGSNFFATGLRYHF